MSGVIPESDESIAVLITDIFKDSTEPATKKELAAVLSAVMACVEGINNSYLVNYSEHGSQEWREALTRWHNSRDLMFETMKNALHLMGGIKIGE